MYSDGDTAGRGEKDVSEMQDVRDSPILTVKMVLDTFQRISQIKTPEVNSKLAIPFKRAPINSSKKFKEEYSYVKTEMRKVSGKSGKEAYHKEKERRMSLPFNWPDEPEDDEGKKLGSFFIYTITILVCVCWSDGRLYILFCWFLVIL